MSHPSLLEPWAVGGLERLLDVSWLGSRLLKILHQELTNTATMANDDAAMPATKVPAGYSPAFRLCFGPLPCIARLVWKGIEAGDDCARVSFMFWSATLYSPFAVSRGIFSHEQSVARSSCSIHGVHVQRKQTKTSTTFEPQRVHACISVGTKALRA